MTELLIHGVIPPGLTDAAQLRGARQVSPLRPGGERLEDIAPETIDQIMLVVPAGTIERHYALALALRALRTGGSLIALGPKDKGGARIRRELEAFGCTVGEDSRKHWRICETMRPAALIDLDAAIAAGAPRRQDELALWTQPGIFCWDRIDEGTALLLAALPPLAGRGADFGCGLGILTAAALASAAVTQVDAVDLDVRAIDAARRNVADDRVTFHWHDLREPLSLADLDFVLMNPPFHSGGKEDIDLGRIFLRVARDALRAGGALWFVANRHLPYEAELGALFKQVDQVTQSGGFKVYRAQK